MTNPATDALLAEQYAQPALQPAPEPDYAPPAPARTGETVAQVGDCYLVSYYEEGQRYAAIGATEADARKLLTDDPAICRVP